LTPSSDTQPLEKGFDVKHPVTHFEIMGHDLPKLGTFYSEVFGWSVAPPLQNYDVEYSLVDPVPGFARGIMGGIGKAPAGYRGHVTFYVVVDGIEAAFAKVEAHGGSRMIGPNPVPNGIVIGLFRDPEGHTIGVVDPGDDMRAAPMELVPFISFHGRCQEALEFYKSALGGSYEIVARDGDKVQYATFTGAGVSFKASDGDSSRNPDLAEAQPGGNISLALHHPDASRAAEIFAALADGATVATPFALAQWGGKFGALRDRFGNVWYVTSE
jgi:uncharacterized protein